MANINVTADNMSNRVNDAFSNCLSKDGEVPDVIIKGENEKEKELKKKASQIKCAVQTWFLNKYCHIIVDITVTLKNETYEIIVNDYTGVKTASLYKRLRQSLMDKYNLRSDQIYVNIR